MEEKQEDKQKYIIVTDFHKYQHYKDPSRPMAWIKLYLTLLDSHRFARLRDAFKWCFVGVLLLAAKKNNLIPFDLKWIRGKLALVSLDENGLSEALNQFSSQGLIAIKVLSKKYYLSILEKRREEIEKRREEKIEKTPLTFNQLYALRKTIFDDSDLEILRVFYKLGFKCYKGEENELSDWLDKLGAEFKDIRWSVEINKFGEYWEAQSRQLKSHKLAWRNWLINATKYAKD